MLNFEARQCKTFSSTLDMRVLNLVHSSYKLKWWEIYLLLINLSISILLFILIMNEKCGTLEWRKGLCLTLKLRRHNELKYETTIALSICLVISRINFEINYNK